MAVTEKLMTASELLEMPDDGFRYELIRGELRQMAPAGHGYIAGNITGPLIMFVKKHGLGRVYVAETGFYLERDPDTVRAPDVAFVKKERIADLDRKGYFPGTPDLVVEVVSPNDVYTEVEEKITEWLSAGTSLAIVVNPRQQTVKVYRSPTEITVLTENDVLDGGDVVSGWQLSVKEIFE